jgi:DNA-binding NtrC family response regulator
MPAEKILIVDDERLVRWSLRQKCEEWCYHIVEAEAGEPGLKVAQHESPDLVLLDVRLPDMSGLEVLEQLKKNGDARAVIMITADPQLDDVKAALKLGAYDFVGKPLDFDELHVTVKNALETTRLRSEVQSLRGEVHRRAGYHKSDPGLGEDDRVAELRPQSGRQRSHHHPYPGRERDGERSDRQGYSLRERPPG